jgi:two-component system nitrate/nitrite response regulator NarL
MRDETIGLVIRVLVADDTRLHTQLLADALRRDGAFEVIGSDSQELVARADLHNFDVLILSSDLDQQPARGVAVLREVRAFHPNARAVVLLDSSKQESVLEAFRAGARGVLSRQESVDTLSKCVKRVHQGQIWADSQQMGLLVQALVSSQNIPALNAHGMVQLSKREMEVVDSVAQGLTNRKIAEHLGLSEHTVKNYLFKVFEKLGVSSRFELLSLAANRIGQSDSAVSSLGKNNGDHGLLNDSNLTECRRAAEEGVPSAQLELARFYWTRKADSKDLMQAYKWYLIAIQQISRTSKTVEKALTIDEILEAEQMAAEWLKKTQKLPAASIRSQLMVARTQEPPTTCNRLPSNPLKLMH